jgi:hypothetical protein
MGMALAAGAGLLVPVLGGEDKTTPPDVAAIPADVAMLVSFRLGDLWDHAALRPVRDKMKKEVAEIVGDLQKALGAPPEAIERLTLVVLGVQGGGEAMLVRLNKSFDRARVLALAGDGATEEKYRGRSLFTGSGREAVALLDDRTYILGQGAPLRTFLDRPVKAKGGPLTPALRLVAEKHAFVLGMNLPEIHEVIKDELPSSADAVRPLLDAQTAAFAADLAEEVTGCARLTFTDAAAAKKGEQAARDGIDLGRAGLAAVKLMTKAKDTAARTLIDEVDAALKAAEVQREETAVIAKVKQKAPLDKLVPAIVELIQTERRRAGRSVTQNHLQQLVLAMYNYHDTYNRRFPPAAIYDKRGKGLLSWRVQILPFIGAQDLYKEFHLDEPWDSDHNKKLLDKMPDVFRAEGQGKTNTTHYQVFTGKGTCFEGKKGIQIQDITDGTSNTILIVEAASAVPWTKPEDLPYDPDKPLPKLGGVTPGGFHAGYADGSVRFLKQDIKESTLRLLIQRNDGQVIPDY